MSAKNGRRSIHDPSRVTRGSPFRLRLWAPSISPSSEWRPSRRIPLRSKRHGGSLGAAGRGLRSRHALARQVPAAPQAAERRGVRVAGSTGRRGPLGVGVAVPRPPRPAGRHDQYLPLNAERTGLCGIRATGSSASIFNAGRLRARIVRPTGPHIRLGTRREGEAGQRPALANGNSGLRMCQRRAILHKLRQCSTSMPSSAEISSTDLPRSCKLPTLSSCRANLSFISMSRTSDGV